MLIAIKNKQTTLISQTGQAYLKLVMLSLWKGPATADVFPLPRLWPAAPVRPSEEHPVVGFVVAWLC